MYNYPYKLYAIDVINELSKSNDKDMLYKFMLELCKLSKLKQYNFEIPQIIRGCKISK